MILDGRAIAEDLYVELAERRKSIVSDVKLGIVVVGDNPVIASFVRIKERAATRLGVTMVRIDLPADASQEVIIGSIQDVAMRSDGVIAQLPFPKGVDVDAVLSAVPVEKDVDALNPTISENKRLVHAPAALAVVGSLSARWPTCRPSRRGAKSSTPAPISFPSAPSSTRWRQDAWRFPALPPRSSSMPS